MESDLERFKPTIVRLQATDLTPFELLLYRNGLPHDDCSAKISSFSGIFDSTRLVAAGGLEVAGGDGLLRSVVVDPDYRSRGLAGSMIHHLIDNARRQHLGAVYLLTETAHSYFTRFGFARVDRHVAPEAIRQTRQFADLCPDSAVFMQLKLGNP